MNILHKNNSMSIHEKVTKLIKLTVATCIQVNPDEIISFIYAYASKIYPKREDCTRCEQSKDCTNCTIQLSMQEMYYVRLSNLLVNYISWLIQDNEHNIDTNTIIKFIRDMDHLFFDIDKFSSVTINKANKRYLKIAIRDTQYHNIVDCIISHPSWDQSVMDDPFVSFKIVSGLKAKYGEFLKDTLINNIRDGVVTIDQLLDPKTNPAVYNQHLFYTPRTYTKALLYNIIILFTDKITTKKLTLAIEKSCYNETVNHCKLSAESYTRQWDSPMWINIYSARIGIIAMHIDPKSSVVIKYGNLVMDRIITKDLNIDVDDYNNLYQSGVRCSNVHI